MPVYFHNEDVKLVVNSSELSIWIKNAVNSLGYTVGDLNVIFCSDEHLKEINIKYLSHDYYTDIRVIIHGVLHLCGFNDKTSAEKKKIREKEDHLLSLITW